jgi:hypothetical protein
MTSPHLHLKARLFSSAMLVLLSAIAAQAAPATRPASHPARPPRPSASQPTTAELESLIQKLGSDDRLERQRAQDRLVTFSTAAEPRLKRLVNESTDEEVVSRAQAVLRLIGEDHLAGPTFITLHVNDADPEAVFRELSKQIRFELLTEPPELWKQKQWPKVTINADHEPFWAVMLSVCRQLHLDPDVTDFNRIRVADTSADWANNPSVVSGPLIIQAEEIILTRTVKFAQPANHEQSTQLTINAFAEPHLRVLPNSHAAIIDSVVDEKGNALEVADKGHAILNPIGNGDAGREWDLTVELIYPQNVGKKIAALKGSLHLVVPSKLETFEVPDVLHVKDLSRVVAGRRIQIRKAHKMQGGYAVEVTIWRDALSDDEWQQMSDPRDFVRLLDDKNQTMNYTGVASPENGDKKLSMTLQFENPGRRPQANGAQPDASASVPLKLVWDLPLEGKEVSFPFEFKDLPLP